MSRKYTKVIRNLVLLNSYSLAIIFWIVSFLAMTLNPVAVRHCEQSEAIQKLNKTPLIYQINNARKFMCKNYRTPKTM